MDIFEKKYGIKEDEYVKNLHISRRMFCIREDKLIIAAPGLSYSHATWFEKEGWMQKEEDDFINKTVRGQIDSKGDVYFYTGWDFQINRNGELIFFLHLKELSDKLNLNPDAYVFGGLVRKEDEKVWPVRRKYGKISDNLK